MTRLRKINLSGFRGVRSSMSLDLTTATKSVAIFGENGSGKSSITDAIEWFFTNRVNHLWREDCNSHSLRNVHLQDGHNPSVAIAFREGPPEGTRTLSEKLTSKISPVSEPLTNYLRVAQNERLILRHQELTHFVAMSKGDKRRFVAEIIGYDAVVSFRDVVLATLNALKSTHEYTSAKARIENHRAQLLKSAGEILTSDSDYFGCLKGLLSELEVKLEGETDEAVVKAETELSARINQEEKARRKLKLQGLSKKLASLSEELDALTKHRADFTPKYEALIENVEDVQKIRLGDFLRKGREILAEDGDAKECPLCLNEVDLSKLVDDVETRIQRLDKIRAKHQAAHEAMNVFVKALKDVERVCGEVKASGPSGICSDLFVEQLLRCAQSLNEHASAVPLSFTTYETIVESDALARAEKALRATIAAEKKSRGRSGRKGKANARRNSYF